MVQHLDNPFSLDTIDLNEPIPTLTDIRKGTDDMIDDELMLTTIDNPHNPKTDYPLWHQWDQEHGYSTQEFIARMLDIDGLIDIDDEVAVSERTNEVIMIILDNDVLGTYKLV